MGEEAATGDANEEAVMLNGASGLGTIRQIRDSEN